MSLQFILGGAGSGKSTYLYRKICEEAKQNPSKYYFVIVPEQFTLETQKTLVKMNGKGIMNIDVLSFNRLAYRVFEEFPGYQKTVLDDMGKTLIVKKVLAEQKNNLQYFGKGTSKPGYLDELKSFLSELLLYQADEETLDQMIAVADSESLFERKLSDLKLIYLAFRKKIEENYMTAEELLPQLCKVVSQAEHLQGATFAFDGFTGFTPDQYKLMKTLFPVLEKAFITLDVDGRDYRKNLFLMSRKTQLDLAKICKETGILLEEPVVLGEGKNLQSYRFEKDGALSFLERSLFLGKAQFPKETDEISLHIAKHPLEEAKWVAREIFWLIAKKGYRYGDFAVVTGALPEYQEYLQTEFERLGMKYFLDNKKGIGSNAVAEFLLSFLEMHKKGMDYESVIRYLRSGMSPLTREEVDDLENVILAQGKRGFLAYKKEWKETKKIKGRYDFEKINEYRERVVDSIEAAMEKMKGGKRPLKEFVEILYELLVNNDIFEKTREKVEFFEEKEMPLLVKEYENVYREMMNLFDLMVNLLGEETVTTKDFYDILGVGISEGFLGFAPPTNDQIMIGDVERSRFSSTKVLFFIGVNDGIIPKGAGSPGILNEKERELMKENQISLAPTAKEKVFTDQFYMYLSLTKPSEKLYVSYSKMDVNGEGKRPSYLIERIVSLFPKMPVIDEEFLDIYNPGSEEEKEKLLGTDNGKQTLLMHARELERFLSKDEGKEVLAFYKSRERDLIENQLLPEIFKEKDQSRLSQKAVDLLYGKELSGSVTRLENYAKCPYKHFVDYGLSLQDRPELQLNSMDYGNVFHAALQEFSASIHEQKKRWRDLDEKERECLAEESVEKAVEAYEQSVFDISSRNKYVVYRMKRIMKRTIEVIAKQMSTGDFEQMAYEIPFSKISHLDETRVELSDGKKMQLNGRIDRIDTIETDDNIFVRVVDYKTGTKEFSISEVYNGLQMQLVVYMETAMALAKQQTGKDAKPAGMFYYQVKDPVLSVYEEDDKIRKDKIAEQLMLKGVGVFQSEVDTMPKGVQAENTVRSKNHCISSEAMEQLQEKARKNMKQFGDEILSGEKKISPFGDSCTFCSYQAICQFDSKEDANVVRYNEKTDKERWEEINGED